MLIVSAIGTLAGGAIALWISHSHWKAMRATRSPRRSEILLTSMGGAGLTAAILGGLGGGAFAAGQAFGGSLFLSLIAVLGWWSILLPNAELKQRTGNVTGRDASDPLRSTPDHLRDERECPWCAEQILAKARVCKHCGRDVPSPQLQAQQ
jgi:hypothetical protein